jgi:Rps23 Pro-64 3,4-dihydroxylase Tpa1-like proline 4-hydroxylase
MMRMELQDYIRETYLSKDVIKRLTRQFSKAKPFHHLELKDFLREEVARELLKALNKEQFIVREADLFKLKHTNDIASSGVKELREFRSFLLSEDFMFYMESITGLKLKRRSIDLSGSLYEDTDYLLCHDDQLEGRKIAFLFYLSDMGKRDGGSLALIGKKMKTAKRIIPKKGAFAFFEVSPVSYHEVEEVLVKKQRLALGGWFHG